MSHIEPDGDTCKNYFKYGKSFPENVKDALTEIESIVDAFFLYKINCCQQV